MDRPERLVVDAAELTRVAAAVAAACAREPTVGLAYLFGSAVRGVPAADLDVGLWLDPHAPAPEMLAACDRVAAAIELAARPALPVDVRPLNGAGPRLRFDVIVEGRLVHERDPGARPAIEAQWLSEWHDFEPFWRRQVDAVLARGAR
jgi:predicted nucleotidyltransferase